MKKLNKLLLTNWHYFTHEVLNFGLVNFLTGKNASGKTTVIDALQLLLLGDTTGHFFNKSASEKSTRSLRGYLRCEFGDTEDGGALYLRNGRFTSYVVGEFYDDTLDNTFTLGIVFDSYEDDSYDGKFFYYNGALPENRFIEGKIPMDMKVLNLFLLNNYSDVTFFPTNTSYREFLRMRLGNLPSTFFHLFKKSIPFTPITNIETFITEYICDVENNINVVTMQENFRNYKKLEIETEELVKRVNSLEDIIEKYNTWKERQKSVEIKRYILERSNLYRTAAQEDKIKLKIADVKTEIEETQAILDKCNVGLKNARNSREKLIEEKFASDVYKRRAAFEEKLEALELKIRELNVQITSVKNNLISYADNWNYGIDTLINDLGKDFADSDLAKQARSVQSTLRSLKLEVAGETVGEAIIQKVYKELMDFQGQLKSYQFKILNENVEISERLSANRADIVSLSSGKKQYDERLVRFKEIIEQALFNKYKTKIAVDILADLLDIKDESWRLAIEAYLGNQRYYLIVDPKYVDDAIRIYDRVKDDLPYYDYGIVDTEKVIANAKAPLANSLSEELTCRNQGAKTYINMHLGTLIKCHDIGKLRSNPRSITKDGMIYQNYVARRLNVNRVIPCIGSGSTKEQLRQKNLEIKELEARLQEVNNQVKYLGKLTSLEILNSNEIRTMVKVLNDTKDLPSLIKEADGTREIVESMSTNYLDTLEKNIQKVTKEIADLESEQLELNNEIVRGHAQIERYLKEELPSQKAQVNELKERINQSFDKTWIQTVGEPAFLDILQINSNPESLYETLTTEIASILKTLDGQKRYIDELRTRYNTIYELNYDPSCDDNKAYEEEYHDLAEIKLKEYRGKIIEAKENALREFRNDFLAKLKSNFDTVISQIEALNDALEHAKFGEDSYRFVASPRREYLAYYEMINDPLLLTGQDIEAKDFTEKYEDVIEDLFRQITFVDTSLGSDIRVELERNIEKFTDYRSYLKFDLIVTNNHGKSQRLSRTLLTKSGGETQTPFYISILASFSQAYRLYLKNERNASIRLIIFDEAFSKMDSERIQESIKLLRNFGLQAIVSAPPDKIPDIVPLVDKTLCVVRNNTISTVKEFQDMQA
ncbi:MAG: ATP-binding protein [Bacilli bacterium]